MAMLRILLHLIVNCEIGVKHSQNLTHPHFLYLKTSKNDVALSFRRRSESTLPDFFRSMDPGLRRDDEKARILFILEPEKCGRVISQNPYFTVLREPSDADFLNFRAKMMRLRMRIVEMAMASQVLASSGEAWAVTVVERALGIIHLA